MPDLLTHYAVSALISSRAYNIRRSAIIALAGLLPDIDALLRIHRWATHSLILAIAMGAVLASMLTLLGRKSLKILYLSMALYITHIIMDIFTAPTPLLWPLTGDAYAISLEVDGSVSGRGITVIPLIELSREGVNFTQREMIEGPIVSPTGVIISIASIAAIAAERIMGRGFKRPGKP
ncbi:MAG: metal-dependent hydrolase [Desulfurococcales archaeon]|jgi:membrane-bound metal-dependent hydrolase YbcI (DUF457 family)|nr:metal-dependent hydrolase [Desulfurococcales archaeon]